MVKNISTRKWVLSAVMLLLPFLFILWGAWYFGFLTTTLSFNDPCLESYSKELCIKNKMCSWEPTSFSCNLKSKCTGTAQQNCGEGCHWDATIKRPNSNLYGVCRPASYDPSAGEGSELK